MNTTSQQAKRRTRYHRDAFQFVFAALRCAQRILDRLPADESEEDEAHISGRELLEGVRQLAIREFGLLANTVFRHWGIRSTADFGHIVFELIERGEMRKTDNDRLRDFFDVYDFEDVFDREYRIETSNAFRE